MQVASLENCRELCELSGWEDTYFWWDKDEQRVPEKQMVVQAGKIFANDIPAYDLGFLLRKLPKFIEIDHPTTLRITIGAVIGGRWCASYDSEGGDFELEKFADTPEDALCKLAIELFKQKILERES